MTEISGFAANRFVLQNQLETESRVQNLRIQASSGKKSQAYDGISNDVRRLQGLESDFAANEAFQRNVDRTELRLQDMESSVDTLTDVASRFRTQLLSAANDGGNLDSIDLGKIAKTFRDEAVGVLNTELGGRFLFSGSATNTKPIDFNNTANFQDVKAGKYYQGNDEILSARIKETTTLDYGVTADPTNETGTHKLFTALQRVIENPSSEKAVEQSIRDISGGEADVSLDYNTSDPSANLDTADGGNLSGALTLNIEDRTGSVIDTINVNTSTNSLNDVANTITSNTNGVSARVANQGGDPKLEIFSDGGTPRVETSGGFSTAAAGKTLDQRVDGAIDELSDTRSAIGSTRGLLETTKSQLDTSQTQLNNSISDVEDVNLTRTMTLLAQNRTSLEASFAITARLQQTSLLNFLR